MLLNQQANDWLQTFDGEVTALKRLRAFVMWLKMQFQREDPTYLEMDIDTGLFVYAVSGKGQFLKTLIAETDQQTLND